jgi:hypothetical protein
MQEKESTPNQRKGVTKVRANCRPAGPTFKISNRPVGKQPTEISIPRSLCSLHGGEGGDKGIAPEILNF